MPSIRRYLPFGVSDGTQTRYGLPHKQVPRSLWLQTPSWSQGESNS
ncbi:hypothetical protein H6F61_10760 [Cyanobacteria bacterium FACHB-472]|nr:hypothetical protein [Cyanobacteria bacterium FACHB-472]